MRPIHGRTGALRSRGLLTRVTGLAMLLLGMLAATLAQASVLVADTTLVSGSETAVFSFDAPGPGTVSVQLTNLNWPQALSSLSFLATNANQVLSSWSEPAGSSAAQSLSFQLAAGGTYFADVTATAGGVLDLGAYSFALNFTPAAPPVPLPSSGALLLGVAAAAAVAAVLHQRLQTRDPPAVSLPAPAAS